MNKHKAIEHKNKFNLPKIEKITAKILLILEQYLLNFTGMSANKLRALYIFAKFKRTEHKRKGVRLTFA